MQRIHLSALAAALIAAASSALAQGPATAPQVQQQVQQQERVYGHELMTPEERIAHQNRMRNAKTAEERERIRAEHHKQMQERAKQRGVTLPGQPPMRGPGGGMGPGPGKGPGPGAGSGAGPGKGPPGGTP